MLDRDFMTIGSWDWTNENEVQSVVDRLNGALSKYAESVAPTAKCKIRFYKAVGTFTSEAYYIYMVEGNSPDNPKILKIMPNTDVATPGCRICAYFNNGEFVMHSLIGLSETDTDGNTGLYVIFGKKGFGLSSGVIMPNPFGVTYEWPLFVSNGVYDDVFIVGRRQNNVNTSAYLTVFNPRYPENPTANAISQGIVILQIQASTSNPVRNAHGGMVVSEQMIPMQVPSQSGSEVLTDICRPGHVTSIGETYIGDISVTNSVSGETARYFTVDGYVSMRLND